MTNGKGLLLGGVAFVVVAAAAVWFALLLKSDRGPDLTGKMSFDQRPGNQVPLDAKLRDESGKTVAFGDLIQDRPVVLMMAFYRCKGSCILQFDGALKAFKAIKIDNIGRDYEVVTVGIHPKETPDLAKAKKNDYLFRYNRPGSDRGWHFMTGDEAEVRKIADAVGFKYFYDPAKDLLVHPTGLVLLTPGGKVSRYFMGAEYSSRLLRESIVAAGANEVGPVAEKTYLLGCFQVDPKSGKILLHAQRATQLLGIITVVALATSIVVMNRKYKRGRYDALEDRLERISRGKEDSAKPDGQA